MVVGLWDARVQSSASSLEVFLNLLTDFSHIIEVRKPSQLAGLIRVTLGWILKPFPSVEKPRHNVVLLFVLL